MKRIFALAAVVVFMATASHAVPVTVYFNDFDGSQVFGSGVTGAGLNGVTTTESSQSLPAPFAGNILRNTNVGNPAAASSIQLLGLPAHNSIDINFLLAFIDSWDSTDGSPAPDYFNVNLNGVNIFQ